MIPKARACLVIAALPALAANCEARLLRHVHRTDCNPTSITEKDIRGFHQVDADLYRGAHPKCSGYAKLAALGIRTIIDLQGNSERQARDCATQGRAGENPFRFDPFDINLFQTTFTGVPSEKLNRLFSLIAEAPKPVFISCKFGEDRTGVVVALYRMKRGEMTYPEARREALYYGFEPRLCGLNRTFKRYRDPRALAALGPRVSWRDPAPSVCRPPRNALSPP